MATRQPEPIAQLAHAASPSGTEQEVAISLPGWHWEVEFMADGSVEVERYESVTGVQSDPNLLEALFAGAEPS
jgi:hypothetical protein